MPIYDLLLMKWIKTIIAGLAASLVMLIVIYVAIISGLAPFNAAPSTAFLYNLGIKSLPLSLVLHFAYGTFWAFVLLNLLEKDVTVGKTLLMALALWLFMMLVYSPIIGYGLFGLGYAYLLNPAHPLYLKPGVISVGLYIISTLLVHLIYGLILGGLASRWIVKEAKRPANEHIGN
jgi:hypothetical protein